MGRCDDRPRTLVSIHFQAVATGSSSTTAMVLVMADLVEDYMRPLEATQ